MPQTKPARANLRCRVIIKKLPGNHRFLLKLRFDGASACRPFKDAGCKLHCPILNPNAFGLQNISNCYLKFMLHQFLGLISVSCLLPGLSALSKTRTFHISIKKSIQHQNRSNNSCRTSPRHPKHRARVEPIGERRRALRLCFCVFAQEGSQPAYEICCYLG